MKLAEYMHTHGLTDEQVAAAVKSDRTTISRIRREKQRPSWPLAEALVRLSDGKVTYPEVGQVEPIEPGSAA